MGGRAVSRLGGHVFGLAAALALWGASAAASPWAEPGDWQLKSDVELLHAHGYIEGTITTWPIPWAQITRRLSEAETAPAHIRAAARRVMTKARAETGGDGPRHEARVRVTNEEALFYGFGSGARDPIEAQIGIEQDWGAVSGRLRLGLVSDWDEGANDDTFDPDGSYIAGERWNTIFYAGLLDSWWGGGWDGSLIMSNNARPMPRIGFMRSVPEPFEWPVLNLLGPWTYDFSMGWMNDDRYIENALLFSGRFAFRPVHGLEIGISHTFQFCGEGKTCALDALAGALVGYNESTQRGQGETDVANHLGMLDLRYGRAVGQNDFAIYGQLGIEDSAGKGFFLGDDAMVLLGASVGGPINSSANWRIVGEYANTILGGVNGPARYNLAYEHDDYRTGYRYRSRVIGHTIDGDGEALGLGAYATGSNDWEWRVRGSHIRLNELGGTRWSGEDPILSRRDETINVFEVGLSLPDRGMGSFDFAIRAMDGTVRDGTRGDTEFQAEVGWQYRF